jgi:microcystin-dependent protein
MSRASELIQTINTLLAPGSNITANEHKQVEASIVNFAASQWVTGDIKMIDCTNEYITENFEDNGKGIDGTLRQGWAICNGNNGTMNRTGRVPMAWGKVPATDGNGWNIQQPYIKLDGQPVLYGNYGEALSVAQMPTHGHYVQTHGSDGGGWAGTNYSGYSQAFPGAIWNQLHVQLTDRNGNTAKPNASYSTQQTGGGAAHNNVQPSMVTLFIQKIDEV